MIDSLFFIIIWIILILLLIAVIAYGNVRVRTFYRSNSSGGDPLSFTASTNSYFRIDTGANIPLRFLPLYQDRKSKIRGRIVILTNSSSTSVDYYRIRAMNGSTVLSEGVYKIEPNLVYNSVNFVVAPGDNRQIQLEIQRYNNATETVLTGQPTGLSIVQAYAWYY